MTQKLKSLFISAWYPNRDDEMSGLFVRKHAQAVSKYCDVKVLYIHGDERLTDFQIEEQVKNGMEEIYVYYPFNKSAIAYKLTKTINYFKAYKKGYYLLQQKGFKPDVVHANVLTRTGFIAYLYKKWKGIPYVITEHWTRYLPENFNYNGVLRKLITKWVVKNASAMMPVSVLLQNSMLQLGLKNENYNVINNVVDDRFFEDVKKEERITKRFLHISCFVERAKNIQGILNATRILLEKRTDFELVIIGNGPDFDKVQKHYSSLNFPKDTVKFLGEQPPENVAWWFQNSDAFILFSNYETAGVVVAESLSSGIPVIATPTGIVTDVINELNGYIVNFKDDNMLQEKMDIMLNSLQTFNHAKIRDDAKQRFSFSVVGKQIYDIYLNS